MEGEGKVEGDPAAGDLRIDAGTAGEAGDPASAPGVVPGVVVLPVVELMDIHAGPLHAVQGTLGKGRIAGGLPAALDLAHSAAEADRIGTDDAAGSTLVGQRDGPAVAFIEGEGAEIDPRGAGHALVHMEDTFASQVTDRIDGIGGAVGEGSVGDIDGVLPAFGDVGPPGGGRLAVGILVGGGFAHPSRPRLEGILIDAVHRFRIGKAGRGFAPAAGLLVAAGAAHPSGALAREGRVVVTDDLPALEVPFARRDDDGAGVLQHRDQVGEDVPLRVHVFHRPMRRRALPFPAFGLGFVIAPVALPEGDVPAGQAPAPFFVGPDQRRGLSPGVAPPQRGLHRPSVLADGRHGQLVEVHVLREDVTERIGPVGGWREAPELFPEPFHIGGTPGEVGQLLAEMEIQRRPPLEDLVELERDFHPRPALHAGAEGIGRRPEFLGGLGRKGKCCERGGEEEGEDSSDHLRSFRRLSRITMRVPAAMARRSARKSRGSPLR